MPVITINDNSVLPTPQEYHLQAQTDSTFAEVNKSMFETGLMYEGAAALVEMGEEYEPDDDYDVFDDLHGYEVYANKFIGIESRREALSIKRRIDEDLSAREVMNAGSGLEIIGAGIANAAVDPISFIPVGGVAYKSYRTGGRILEGAAKTAAAGAAISTGEELVLQQLQEVRTTEESFMNVGATTLLSGLLGGAASMFGSRTQIDELAKRLDDDLTNAVPDSMLRREESTDGSLGAAEVPNTTIEDETLQSALGLEKVMQFNDPVLRTLNSPSVETRRLSEQLAETYLLKNKNSDFKASEVSVENLIKSYDLPKYKFYQGFDEQFLKYREASRGGVKGVQLRDMAGKARKDGKMTYSEFGEEVVKAARRNDSHVVPEIAAAAKALREQLFDPIFRRGVDAGIFEDGIQVKTAPSYVTRLYNKDAIMGNLPRWKEQNAAWMRQRRDEAADSLPEIEGSISKSKEVISLRRKEVAAVEETTFSSILTTAEQNMAKSVDDALEEITLNGIPERAPITEADVVASATRKQNQAYLKALRSELSEDLSEVVDEVLQKEFRGIVDDVVGITDEVDAGELFDFIKGDLLQPMKKTAADVSAGKVTDRLEISQTNAIRKSIQSFQKSYDAQMKRLGQSFTDEQNLKAVTQKITADIKSAARSSAQKAAKEASATLREEMKGLIQELKDNQSLLKRNAYKSQQLDEEIDNVVDELTNRILSTPAGRLPYDAKLRSKKGAPAGAVNKGQLRGAARERVYDIPDELIEDFLVNDPYAIAESYTRSLASDIELTRKFGSVDFTDTLKKIEEDYSRLSHGADAKTQRHLKEAFDRDVRDFTAMWERLRGTYALPDDYAKILPTAERMALNLNYMRLLGGMTLSAFTDIARPVMAHGLGNVYQHGIRAAVKNFKTFRRAAEDVKETGTALDMVLNTRARAQAGFDDYIPFANRMEGAVGKMANSFGVISLMAPWNATMKQFSGVITQSRFIKAALDIADGKPVVATEKTNLAANFIDEPMAKRIAAQYRKYGQEVDDVIVPMAQAWDDMEVQEIFRAAVRREVDSIIVTPGQDKPLWMSRPGWKLLGQFKSFAFASVQRTMMSGLQKRDMATLNGSVLSLFLGMGVYAAKENVAERKLSDDWRIWVTEGIDRSGLTGWAFDANNMVEKLSRGRIGINASIGGPPMSRYASRSVLEALFGPTYGMLGDVAQVAGSAFSGDWRESDTRTLRKLMPYQNIFYLRKLFDEAEQGINAMFNIPESGGKK